MSASSKKRASSNDSSNQESTKKRVTTEGINKESREVDAGMEFTVLQAYREFEEVINQERVQMARTGDINIAMKSLDRVDALYKKVEGTKNNGLFAHDAKAMVCISELAEISVRNLKFDDTRSLVNLDDIVNGIKKFMLKEYFITNEITDNFTADDDNGHVSEQDESADQGPYERDHHTLDTPNLGSREADHLKESTIRRNRLQHYSNYNAFEQFNWFKMGALFEHLSKAPLSVDHLLGPLSLTRKIRAQINRRERETVSAVMTAEKVTQSTLSISQEATTPEHVRRCFKILSQKKGYQPINLFEFIIDPNSFPKSVENLFYTSFLIKEGRIVMDEDAEGFPCIRIKEELPTASREKGIEVQKRRDAHQNHIIFQLDMPTWRSFIKGYNIKVAFLD